MIDGIGDYLSVALRVTRAEFVDGHPWYFLVGVDPVKRARQREPTEVFEVINPAAQTYQALAAIADDDELTPVVSGIAPSGGAAASSMLLAVRKVHFSEPSIIVVGRLDSCDVVISDGDVSRRHAYFVARSDHILLGDLGSANGTMINGHLLEPTGTAQIVVPGDRLRFALLEFELLDAASAWDRLHAAG